MGSDVPDAMDDGSENAEAFTGFFGPLKRQVHRLQQFLHRHGAKLWWAHSLYALGVGAFVVFFAQRGFAYARVVVSFLMVAWILLILLFRFFGSGKTREMGSKRAVVGYYAMTYVLKNLHQGMLFFALPFYYKSTTFGSSNQWFFYGLTLLAILSTVDVIFDRLLMRWRALAFGFYAVVLFANLNLLLPTLLPATRTLWTLMMAGTITAFAVTTMAKPLWFTRAGRGLMTALSMLLVVACLFLGRSYIPAVPMSVARGAVGPGTLSDGRLTMEARVLHKEYAKELFAVTDVTLPSGFSDPLHHIWRNQDGVVFEPGDRTEAMPLENGELRLLSQLKPEDMPENKVGPWFVEVVSEDGRLIGQIAFEVIE